MLKDSVENYLYEEVYDMQSFHPLRRFVAKSIDILCSWSIVAFLAILIFYIYRPFGDFLINLNYIAATLVYFLLMSLIESSFCSIFGNSPGKAICKIVITDKKGQRLSFLKTLFRNLLVFSIGLGFLFPPLTLLSFLFTYKRLRYNGQTLWDEKAGSVVVFL